MHLQVFIGLQIHISFLGILLITLGVISKCQGVPDSCCFTPEQQRVIKEFRSAARDLEFYGRTKNFLNTSFSSSFLAGRNFNVKEAVEDVRRVLKWRKLNRIDDDILNLKTLSRKEYPLYADGTDADGRPVVIAKAGEWDIRRSFIVQNQHNISMYVLQALEEMFDRLLKYNEKTGNDVSRGILIIDLFGYNIRQNGCAKCLATYVEWITYFELYYKGFIKNLFMINVPRIFEPVIRLIWPLMSYNTRQVLKVFGPRREDWQRALLEIIPAEQLPISFGGTKKVIQTPLS